MKNSTLFSLAFALTLLLAAQNAQAQAQIELGPRVGYEVDDLEALSIGADLRISSFALPVQINPAFDYYFVDDDNFTGTDVTFFQITANALYQFGINNQVFVPYAGPGLSYSRISFENTAGRSADDSELGLNLVGGAEFGVQNLKLFAQAEFVVGGDAQPVKIVGGLLFGLGGR